MAIVSLITMANGGLCQGIVLYRYTNEAGVKVLTYSIPAKYIPNGYEIVDSSGRLIEVVQPELSPEAKAEAAAAKAEMEERQTRDRKLLKRYSRVGDIEAAKNRKLAEISADINILRGNVLNLNNEIGKLQSQAATMERRGQSVPDTILDNIDSIKKELVVIADRIELREREYRVQVDKFDEDMNRFLVIKRENTVN